jgi:heme-degrading monooxygenase HmoA
VQLADHEEYTSMNMPKMENVDPAVSIMQQLSGNERGPVVLLNTFTVAQEDVAALLENWERDAKIMKRQPGLISAQLHRGTGGSTVFVNYAVWESLEHFRAAFRNPEFQAALSEYPRSTVAKPVLLQKIAIPGVCVA